MKPERALTVDVSEAYAVHNALATCGTVSRLRFNVDVAQLRRELEPFESLWQQYNTLKPLNRREGLNVTSLSGSHDGPSLESLREVKKPDGSGYSELDFTTPTEIHRGCISLQSLFEHFSPLARTHFLRLKAGGHFPPHRDLDPLAFRLILPCFSCNENDWAFLIEGERVRMEPGWVYYVNTRQLHSVFSFSEECTFLVMNVPATRENCLKTIAAFSPI